jgi:hypothetical protein
MVLLVIDCSFSKAIMEGKESKVSGEQGLKDHLVLDAIFKSIASGKAESVREMQSVSFGLISFFPPCV